MISSRWSSTNSTDRRKDMKWTVIIPVYLAVSILVFFLSLSAARRLNPGTVKGKISILLLCPVLIFFGWWIIAVALAERKIRDMIDGRKS